MKILIVDDEPAFLEALQDNLMYEGFEVTVASGGHEALDYLKSDIFNLIILDVMMPDLDGFGVATFMKKNNVDVPVIFLTARSADTDKLRGLNLGADDYVTKPFNLCELIARVKAVLRRTSPGSELKTITIGDRVVDLVHRTIGDESIGRYETELIRLLASDPGKVFSRDEILDQIWGIDAYPSNRTIDNYIVKLRSKLEPDPKKPRFLHSIYGSGYKLTLTAKTT